MKYDRRRRVTELSETAWRALNTMQSHPGYKGQCSDFKGLLELEAKGLVTCEERGAAESPYWYMTNKGARLDLDVVDSPQTRDGSRSGRFAYRQA